MKNHKTAEQSSILLFFLVFFLYALVYMTKNCYSAAMASIVKEGIMTKSQTGLIASMFYIVYAPFQVLGGVAADKYSEKTLIAVGVIGAGVANLLIYFVQDYIAMIIIWSLNAVVQFGIWPGIFKIITTRIIPEQRVKSIFYISMASSVGLLFSYLLSMCITNWKHNFLLSAAVLFISAAVFIAAYTKLDKKLEKTEAVRAAHEKTGGNIFKLFTGSGLVLLFVVYLGVNLLNLGVKSLVPVMLMESYDSISPSLANGLNIILVVVSPLGMLLAKNEIFTKHSAVSVISFLVAMSLPFLAVITALGKVNIAFVVASFAALMLFMASTIPFFSQVSLFFHKYGRSATIAGIFNGMAALGIVLANYVFTRIAEAKGWIFTTRCWLYMALGAWMLSLIAIPVWKKFIKK